MSQVAIAILASGRGTNFTAILKAIEQKKLRAKVVALVSDRSDSMALEIAKGAGIPALFVRTPKASDIEDAIARRRAHDEAITKVLAKFNPHFLVFAGYMRIVTPILLEPFRSSRGYYRVTNIHPSILPAFPGVNSYAQAFQFGCKVAGVTVHLVDEKLDSGPICAQAAFSIAGLTTEIEVEQEGLRCEHRLYSETLSWVLPEKFEVKQREQGRLCVCPH